MKKQWRARKGRLDQLRKTTAYTFDRAPKQWPEASELAGAGSEMAG